MAEDKELRCSVLTSSSIRDLPDFFAEVRLVSGVDLFDLMILRDVDIENIEENGINLHPGLPRDSAFGDTRAVTELLSHARNYDVIREWIVGQCKEGEAKIAALATYFPDVTSLCSKRRESAIGALTNTVRLALALTEAGVMMYPIVEMVCGTILDPCECEQCRPDGRIFVYERSTKMDILCNSLRHVVNTLKDSAGSADLRFGLALELEPGETYVLNDVTAMSLLFERIHPEGAFFELAPFVGLNLDIAHMRIAGIEAAALRPFLGKFVHAHIADHPGMHTRDQVVGSWTHIERDDQGYYPFLQLLMDRADQAQRSENLPFSGAVALELEGCNRISWIHASLDRMKHLTQVARRLYARFAHPTEQRKAAPL